MSVGRKQSEAKSNILIYFAPSRGTIVERIKACQMAGQSIGRAWQQGKRKALEIRCVGSLLVVYLCVTLLCLVDAKDSSSACKGLMTNWPTHIIAMISPILTWGRHGLALVSPHSSYRLRDVHT